MKVPKRSEKFGPFSRIKSRKGHKTFTAMTMLGVGRVAQQGHLSDDPPRGLPLRWPCWVTRTKKIWRASHRIGAEPIRLLSRPNPENCACVRACVRDLSTHSFLFYLLLSAIYGGRGPGVI